MGAEYFSLATTDFFQDWSNKDLIVADHQWQNVQSIVGYLGDYTGGTPTAVDPRTLTAAAGTQAHVFANLTNPITATSGGVAEFNLANPTIALQGSGTADAPNIVLYLNAEGRKDLVLSFLLRDIDASADNAVQPIAVQYRTSATASWTNVAGGYFPDVTTGPSVATATTSVTLALPGEANNAATLEVRIMTVNAASTDEWVGIDDIRVTSVAGPIVIPDRPGAFSIGDATIAEGNSGTTPISFTVSRGTDSNVAATVSYAVTLPGRAAGASADDFASPVLSGTLAFGIGEFAKTVTLNVAGDILNEADETFTVTLTATTNGATIADASGVGTIQNDDAAAGPGVPFINEIHYDNASTDQGEAIEIAGPAGFSLAGWKLYLYNGDLGANNAKVYLSGGVVSLAGVIPSHDDGYGTLVFTFPTNGIQNGPNDGVALVDPSGRVVQFLSYEGTITATDGPASGLTSTDIGVEESGSTAVGHSLQLTGSGASAADFVWAAAAASTYAAPNTGQNFIAADATGLVRVADASVVEGDAGTRDLVFTVHRAGGLGSAASVDWALDIGSSATLSDLAAGQPLSGTLSFAVGASSAQVVVKVAGDTVGEPNELLGLILSNAVGNVAIVDATATGTILNDDPIPLRIFEIQGESHGSAYVGQRVSTTGIVTAVASDGFYLQDATGDGNARTSDAIFVYTGAAPTVARGDEVKATGSVAEHLPGNDPNNLTITRLNANAVAVQSTGNALPAAVLIGTGGRLPPTETIDDDSFAVFDPENDGIDFYESLEGMRVTIDAPLAVSNSNGFGETYVVASGGAGATGVNARGGITISDGDYNPEKIQIDASSLFAGYTGGHSQGDRLGDVTGIVSYGFNSYEVLVTEAVTVTENVTLGREATSLSGGRDHLTVASYNVENLDPGDGATKFNLLAQDIVYRLAAPDIIAVQEIQDADGAGSGSNLSGQPTAQMLIDAIAAAGGPTYIYVEIAPSSPNSTGGEPGGNIRNGYFYNPDRVSYIAGSATLLTDAAFNGTRRPLVADFKFNEETVRLVNVHFTSRGGSDPLWGADQPPADAGDGARAAQGAAVASYVSGLLGANPALKLGVLGDFNGFWFEDNIVQLETAGLFNLHRLNPEEERYSYLFDGNLQALDHFLVSGGLRPHAQYDAVHINAEQPSGSVRATDHDPSVGRFFIEHPNEAPLDLAIDDAAVDENAPTGTLVGIVSADDPDEDVLAYTLVDSAGGLFALDPATGRLTTTQPLDHETAATRQIVVRATDPNGLYVDKAFTITVANVNEAPTAGADAASVDEDSSTGNLWSLLLGNDGDPDAGAVLTIVSVDTTGLRGTLHFNPATQTLSYTADHDSFDSLPAGQTSTDTFSYTVADQNGLTSTATVTLTVTGVADGLRLAGGNGADLLEGGAGEDNLSGGNAGDVLRGGGGHDWLDGGNGVDSLYGGAGNDVLIGGAANDFLSGGAGRDLFVFGRGGGNDHVSDYQVGADALVLQDGIEVRSHRVADVNGDGVADLSIAFSNGGGSVTLLGVGSLDAVSFAAPEVLAGHPAI